MPNGARIVFDLDGTMVGFKRGRLSLNRKLLGVARKLRAQRNRLILWTFGNRNWWREVRRTLPELKGLFHEVYTRDELPGHITRGVKEYDAFSPRTDEMKSPSGSRTSK